MSDLPMLPSQIYSEQVNVRIDIGLKSDIRALKGLGVDVAQLMRQAIQIAVKDALEQIKPNESAV